MTVEHAQILLLAPVVAAAAFFIAARGRRFYTRTVAAACAALAVVALAGVFGTDARTLRVFVLDASMSMRGLTGSVMARVPGAAKSNGAKTDVAVVAFGRSEQALVPPTPSNEFPRELPAVSGIDQQGTSIERALFAANKLFSTGAKGDIVLVTDGAETEGDALYRAGAIPVHSFTVSAAPQNDAWVEAVRAPQSSPAGVPVGFEIILGSNAPLHGKLVLLVDGVEMAAPEPLDISSRRVVLARSTRPLASGLHTITARFLCPEDGVSENNELSAAVDVRGPLRVLCLTDAAVPAWLIGGGIDVREMKPDAFDSTNEELLDADVVALNDVSADSLGPTKMSRLAHFCTDAGGGILVIGGRNSFGPGGYARTPLDTVLPVDPDPERRAGEPASVAIVADRSGSMAAEIGGRQKIDYVREAILDAAQEFRGRTGGAKDELSIIIFNQAPTVMLERAAVAEKMAAVRAAASDIFPSGRTQIKPALDRARKVLAESRLKRHVIIVSDGESQDPLVANTIAAEFRAAKIVLTVIATSAKMNDGLTALKSVAGATGGRFVMLQSLADLPAELQRETRQISGSLIREGDFGLSPGPAWPKELAAGRISGFVLTGSREGAENLLMTGDSPVLSRWRRGLGRVVACTASPEWAKEWTGARWQAEFGELTVWAGGGERVQAADVYVTTDGVGAKTEITTTEDVAGLWAVVIAPGGAITPLDLRRMARLKYEAAFDAPKIGTYVVVARTSERLLGRGHVTIGYSPEWRPRLASDVPARLSRLTGGQVLKHLEELPPLAGAGGAARRNISFVLFLASAAAFALSLIRR